VLLDLEISSLASVKDFAFEPAEEYFEFLDLLQLDL
jgi:hypothetical protein